MNSFLPIKQNGTVKKRSQHIGVNDHGTNLDKPQLFEHSVPKVFGDRWTVETVSHMN